MNGKISVIIADDHPIVRNGLRQMLERENDLEILLECGDGVTALKEILLHQPNIAILDIDMPHKSGLEVLKSLTQPTIFYRQNNFVDGSQRRSIF